VKKYIKFISLILHWKNQLSNGSFERMSEDASHNILGVILLLFLGFLVSSLEIFEFLEELKDNIQS